VPVWLDDAVPELLEDELPLADSEEDPDALAEPDCVAVFVECAVSLRVTVRGLVCDGVAETVGEADEDDDDVAEEEPLADEEHDIGGVCEGDGVTDDEAVAEEVAVMDAEEDADDVCDADAVLVEVFVGLHCTER
jgi:hypothetical protein